MGSSASSIPYPLHDGEASPNTPEPRGGEADEPTRFIPIRDTELRPVFLRAHNSWAVWAERHDPSLLHGQLELWDAEQEKAA